MIEITLLVAALFSWYYGCVKWQTKKQNSNFRMFAWFAFQALGIVTITVTAIKCNYSMAYQAMMSLDWTQYSTAIEYNPYLYSILFLWCADIIDNDSTRLKYRDGINAFGKEKVKKLIFSVSGIATIFVIGTLS